MKTGIYDQLVKKGLWIVLFPFGAIQIGMIGGYVLIHHSDLVCQVLPGNGCEPWIIVWVLVALGGIVNGLLVAYSIKQVQKLSHSIAQPVADICSYLDDHQNGSSEPVFQDTSFAEFKTIQRHLTDRANKDAVSTKDSKTSESNEQSSSDIVDVVALQQGLFRLTALTDKMNKVLDKPEDRIRIKQLCQKIVTQLEIDQSEASTKPLSSAVESSDSQDIYIQGFDFSELLLLINHNQEQLLNILQMFVEDFGTINQEVHGYLQQNQIDRAEERIHQVKGTAGNIGAKELLTVSQLLDDKLKQNQVDPDLWQQWETVFSFTIHNVRRCLSDHNIHIS